MTSNNWLRKERNLLHAKIATMLAGIFFVLLGLYWVTVFWWSRSIHNHVPLHKRDFSPCEFLWWLLSLFFIGVLSSLATQVQEHHNEIFNDSRSGSGGGMSISESNDDGLEANNWIILVALFSMVLFWLIYATIFAIVTIKDFISRYRHIFNH